jgi:hypothetical protein
VPNVCGADVMATSDFELKPLKLTIVEATEEDLAKVPQIPPYRNQRTPADFKIKTIKADRELRRDPSYHPEFTNVPPPQYRGRNTDREFRPHHSRPPEGHETIR